MFTVCSYLEKYRKTREGNCKCPQTVTFNTKCVKIGISHEAFYLFQKEKVKAKSNDAITLQKYQKFRQAMGLSGDEDASTD